MKILVSGATGFMGRHLLSRLSNEHEVFALAREAQPKLLEGKRVSFILTDFAGEIDTRSWPKQLDAIIHLAQANVPLPEGTQDLFAVNTLSTQKSLDYARRVGVKRFLLASSGDVYGNRTGMSRETDTASPASLYGVSKYAAELLVQAYSGHFQTCILRFFRPYGPGQTHRLIPNLAAAVAQRRPVQLHKEDRPHLTPIFIEDGVSVFERAIQSSYSGILNVAGDAVVSIRELAKKLGQILKAEPLFQETGEESPDSMGDNTRMKEVLGRWPLVELDEGLARTFASREEARWQVRV